MVALGLSKGGFAGIGQMATPLLALAMPPLEAAAIMLPIMILQDASAVWVYRKDWSGRVLAIVIPGAVIGIAVAWAASPRTSPTPRCASSSASSPSPSSSTTGPACCASPREAPRRQRRRRRVLGRAVGLHLDICQAGGPPYQIYVLAQQLPKMTFVGTSAIFFAA